MKKIYSLLGFQTAISTREILVSAFTAAIAMVAVYIISHAVLGETDAPLMVASMGSSAILIFAVPHGAFSQPWSVIAGHAVCAAVGVASAMLIPSLELACAVAVGVSIALSLLLRCLHPSGGGTTLVPVLGGEVVRQLGFSFVLVPVVLNAAILVLLGVLLNAAFAWRRYPVALAPRTAEETSMPAAAMLSHDDLAHALQQMETSVEIPEIELARIFEVAMAHAQIDHVQAADIQVGGCYGNAAFGTIWSVRRVLGMETVAGRIRVRYEVVAGSGQGMKGAQPLADFASWARRTMAREDGEWKNKPAATPGIDPAR
jgi:CBS-domain-containing membrane protein